MDRPTFLKSGAAALALIPANIKARLENEDESPMVTVVFRDKNGAVRALGAEMDDFFYEQPRFVIDALVRELEYQLFQTGNTAAAVLQSRRTL